MMHWSAYDYDECSPNCVSLFRFPGSRADVVRSAGVYGRLSGRSAIRSENGASSRNQRGANVLFEDSSRDSSGRGARRHYRRKQLLRGQNTVIHPTFPRRLAERLAHGQELPYQLVMGDRELPNIGFYGSIDDVLRLRSGRIVVAFMFMDPERSNAQTRVQHYALVCLFSDDGGRTWNRSGEITVDTPRGAMECQIVETDPDRLLCLFRTKAGYVYQSVSDDGGESWSPSEPTSLPSPESMVRMIRLQSGKLLVVWNNVSSTSQQPRHPLVAALSKMAGVTWGEPRIIAEETGTNQLSNHGMVQLDDGRILLGISHYRDVRPMTSDLDLAILDEQALSE